jgi:hypothetical protein
MRASLQRVSLCPQRVSLCLLAAALVLLAAEVEGAPPHAPAPTRVAAPVSTHEQYRGRVREATVMLEELAAFYEQLGKHEKEEPEVWKKEGFDPNVSLQLPKIEQATLDRVRGLLPPKEKVEWGVGSLEVDNSWLYPALEEYKRKSAKDESAQALRAIVERLRALEARLAEVESGTPREQDNDAERGRLNAILRDPAFNRDAQQQGNALQRLLQDIREWLKDHLPGLPSVEPGTNPLTSLLAQLFVFALCLAVIAYVARRVWLRRARGPKPLKSRRRARVVLGEHLEADRTAADLLEEAERLARAGDLRGAIRKAYIALLCELGDRGVVRLAQHKTNRDYLNAVRKAAPPRLYTEMLPLTFNFELHWYGLQDASEHDWNDFRTRCRQALKVI